MVFLLGEWSIRGSPRIMVYAASHSMANLQGPPWLLFVYESEENPFGVCFYNTSRVR